MPWDQRMKPVWGKGREGTLSDYDSAAPTERSMRVFTLHAPGPLDHESNRPCCDLRFYVMENRKH